MNPMIQVKALAATVKAVESDNPNGEFEAILSTPAVDRDGEAVAPGAFAPLPAQIPIYYAHDWKTNGLPVGKGEPFYDGDILKIKGVFGSSTKAQEVRTAVAEGLVGAMSVGYVNSTTVKRNGVRTITKGDLFESSFTGIPVNPTAAVLASKDVKAGARNNKTDAERLQSIHDLAVENGATCAMSGKAHDDADTKAIVGTLEAKQERIRDALQDKFVTDPENQWLYLRGTFDDRVVYELWDGSASDTYEVAYADDGTVVTIDAEPTAVDTQEVVVPDPDASSKAVAATAAPNGAAVAATADAKAEQDMSELRALYTQLAADASA